LPRQFFLSILTNIVYILNSYILSGEERSTLAKVQSQDSGSGSRTSNQDQDQASSPSRKPQNLHGIPAALARIAPDPRTRIPGTRGQTQETTGGPAKE